MRGVVITYISAGRFSYTRMFSDGYQGLTDERMINKAQRWAVLHLGELRTPETCSVTFYGNILDVSTARQVPLI